MEPSADPGTRSFERFVDDRLPRLLRLTGALTGDRHLAEDLVQDVLVRVHRDWERIGALDVPEAYVRRMLVNEYVSWRRRWARFSYQGAAAGVQGGTWDRPGLRASTSTVAVIDVLTGAGEDPVPLRPADAAAVDVGGADGWSAPWRSDLADLHFGMDPADTLTVWRDDTSGLWIALTTVGFDAARIAQLAGTVQVADYHPVRVPVRLAWVPPGLSVTGVFTNAGFVDLAFGAEGTGFNLGIGPVGTVGGGGAGTALPQALEVGAFRGVYRADDPVTVVSDGVVDVSVTSDARQASAISGDGAPAAMPLDTLTRLLAGLTVADLGDPASWTDLSAALPAS